MILKTKIPVFLVLAFLISVAFVSATPIFSVTTQTPIQQNVSREAVSSNIAFNLAYLNASESANLTFSYTTTGTSIQISNITIAANSTPSITATVNFPSNQRAGTTVTGTIFATATSQSGLWTETKPIPFAIQVLPTNLIIISKVQDFTLAQDAIINISNRGNTDLANINLTSDGDFDASFSNNNLQLPMGSSTLINLSATLSNLKFGTYSIDLEAKDLPTGAVSNALSFSVSKPFCRNNSIGDLVITKATISNSDHDRTTWQPLDRISIEVTVRNDADIDLDDIIVELGLFDDQGVNVAGDLDFTSKDDEKASLGDLSDGDKDSVTIEFTLPADFETGDYKLALKAYSDAKGESRACGDRVESFSDTTFQTITVERETDSGKFIGYDKITISPSELTYGDTATLSFNLINLGDKEQDQIKLILFNKDLNINLVKEIKENLAAGEIDKDIKFTFDIPATAIDKTYSLDLTAEYNYRSGTYRDSSDDSTKIPIKLIGCSATPTSRLTDISAELQSEAIAGEEMVVKSTIKNLAGKQTTFVIDVRGYDSWATLESLSDRIITLDAGESKDIIIKLKVNKDAADTKLFAIETRAGEKVESTEVSVNVQASSTSQFSLSGLFKGSALIWTIAVINLVLIILIILVALRLSRK